ncbi:unnamed protein product, partial [Prorocentrum cordatum]
GGKPRIGYSEFVGHFEDACMLRKIWRRIDADGSNEISKLEVIAAVNKDPEVAALLLPGVSVASRELDLGAVDAAFNDMSGGKNRVDYSEFVGHLRDACALRHIWRRIDADGSNEISKLEFIAAIHKEPEVAEILLPGVDTGSALSRELNFEAVDAAFDDIAGGKPRVGYAEFVDHFRDACTLRNIWRRIDTDGSNEISKLEVIAAVNKDPEVAALLFPGASPVRRELNFEAVDAAFDEIAGGKSRVGYPEFVNHLRHACALRSIWRRIDADGSNSISKLEFIAAVHKESEVAAVLLPGVDTGSALSRELNFKALDEAFDNIAGGKPRVGYSEFVDHFRDALSLRSIWRRIDADGSNEISKLEVIAAINKDPEVAALLLPGASPVRRELDFGAVDAAFDEIAGGKSKSRVGYSEFVDHLRDACALRSIWRRIDADGSNSISKLEFIAATHKDPEVASVLLPGVDTGALTGGFEAVDAAFDGIAGG